MDLIEILPFIGGCFHQVTQSYGLPLSLFLAGLVGSASHCVVMCGPLVISQTGNMDKLRDAALVPYHLGRMTTYVFMAVLAYSIFSLIFVYSDLKSIIAAPMLFLAGIIFIVSAFPRLNSLFPWVSNIQISLPLTFVNKVFSKLSQKHNMLSRYGLGILLGFMPCGLVVAALIASTSAPTLWGAIISMSAFALGTVPALILVAIGGSSLKKKYPQFAFYFSRTAKIVSALWLFALAGTLIL